MIGETRRALLGILAGGLAAAGSVSVTGFAEPVVTQPVMTLRQTLATIQSLDELKTALGPLLPRLGATLHEDKNLNGPYVHLHFKTPTADRALAPWAGAGRTQPGRAPMVSKPATVTIACE
jgi:hypothetical protein